MLLPTVSWGLGLTHSLAWPKCPKGLLHWIPGKMPEKITAENLVDKIVETIAENVPKQKSVSFLEGDKSDTVPSQFNRLFGRQKPLHRLFGGGKCTISWLVLLIWWSRDAFWTYTWPNCAAADVLLWRNKKISASVLAGATVIWVLFEWLEYHFLTLVCFAVILAMLAQFLWSNASGLLSRLTNSYICSSLFLDSIDIF